MWEDVDLLILSTYIQHDEIIPLPYLWHFSPPPTHAHHHS
jgi:hypothetical protein